MCCVIDRLLSLVYTTKLPSFATEDCKTTSFLGHETLLRLLVSHSSPLLCHCNEPSWVDHGCRLEWGFRTTNKYEEAAVMILKTWILCCVESHRWLWLLTYELYIFTRFRQDHTLSFSFYFLFLLSGYNA